MTYANEQLKRTLAKMFPEKVKHTSILVWTTPINYCCEVRDTEVERTKLKGLRINVYCRALEYECDCMMAALDAYAATWQQRTIALAKTLGIEIV